MHLSGHEPADLLKGPNPYSILLIEDNADLLQYLAEKFSEKFEVFGAHNGPDALTKAFDHVPDLIVSDIVLPGLSGKDLLKTLKSDVRTSHIPIILLIARVSLEHQLSGLQSLPTFELLLLNLQFGCHNP